MAKTIATILGAGFVLIGLIGFLAPGFLHTHLSLTHNFIHLVSGAAALYFGLAGTLGGRDSSTSFSDWFTGCSAWQALLQALRQRRPSTAWPCRA